jgi:GxxExxY protein
MRINEWSGQVVDSAMKVHSTLGPGLLESAYQACLAFELRRRGLNVVVQHPVEVLYDGVRLPVAYRIDLLINDCIVVELKTVSALKKVHQAQLLSYLKLSGYPLGLLINFHVPHLRNGIRRVVNNL